MMPIQNVSGRAHLEEASRQLPHQPFVAAEAQPLQASGGGQHAAIQVAAYVYVTEESVLQRGQGG